MTDFNTSLNVMWQGMLGIFVTMAVIMLVILSLNMLTKKRGEKK
ncbi:MAG: hypothetical protein PHI27_01725 [Eubacteriales bacterium]|nr:hypothetical protein [Eubacteriales bacterium]MDD3880951.1 hypothetical protein [Eubacteriales bacterium]MDD4511980.1 hypothetical protein [Eubacteriales bacterium]